MKRFISLVICLLLSSIAFAEPQVGTLIRGAKLNGESVPVRLDENGYLITNLGAQARDSSNVIVGVDYKSGNSGIDAATEVLEFIEYEHHEIHSGSFYRAGFQKDIPNGGTAIFTITTPDTTKWIHFRPAVDVELEAAIMVYENPTSVTGGSAVIPRNANRNSLNTSMATVLTDPTINTSGAIVLGNLVEGSGKSSGGDSGSEHEWILKQNTTYVIVVTNQATGATNECNIRCQWYEHTNKN